jgi:putative PIN family toxin of toxin-antitoxin system
MNRAVLDANVVISGMISAHGPSAAVLDAWRNSRFELVTCEDVLGEVLEKIGLPRIARKYRIDRKQIAAMVTDLRSSATWVPARTPVAPPPPDQDDTMLFSAAIESNADYVVTGDKALLTWKWPGRALIVTPRMFVEVLDEQSQ